jgi:pimeloyl-ACP methyl ester carboxylesterase
MNRIVPTDLLEIPVINYFKYRNNGVFDDFDTVNDVIQTYLPSYGKNPREIFHFNESPNFSETIWTKKRKVGGFIHSTGLVKTSYKPMSPILRDKKYDPVFKLITQKYEKKIHNGALKTENIVVFIHGYAEDTFKLHEQSYFRLFKYNFNSDVLALELPYHFHRQPSDSPFSGAYYLNGNPIRMLESVRQSIQEIVHLVNSLKEEYSRVIIFGISLGGHLVALSSQFLNGVDIIAALATPFLFRINPKIVPVSTKIVKYIKTQGLIDSYKILAATNLKYFTPHTTNKNTAIMGGRYDRIVPFSQVKILAKMLNKPLLAYPGGHISIIFWLNSLLSQINRGFLES